MTEGAAHSPSAAALESCPADNCAFTLPHPVSKKVPIKGVGPFAVAPTPGKTLLAAFVPEAKGQPAAASIVDASSDEPVTLSRRSFYRATGAGPVAALRVRCPCWWMLHRCCAAQHHRCTLPARRGCRLATRRHPIRVPCQPRWPNSTTAASSPAGATMMWNATSTACLFMATSDTDATNQSYYGESKVPGLIHDLLNGQQVSRCCCSSEAVSMRPAASKRIALTRTTPSSPLAAAALPAGRPGARRCRVCCAGPKGRPCARRQVEPRGRLFLCGRWLHALQGRLQPVPNPRSEITLASQLCPRCCRLANLPPTHP